MSQFNIYLKTPDYLSDWLRGEMWNDEEQRIVFPRNSAEWTVLCLFIGKRPDGAPVDLASDGLLPVKVPTQPGKNPAVYNYMSEAGKLAIVNTIKRRFKKMMWDELHVIKPDEVQITDIIYAFMEKHGISATEKNWETIRQMYFRMRKVYGPK